MLPLPPTPPAPPSSTSTSTSPSISILSSDSSLSTASAAMHRRPTHSRVPGPTTAEAIPEITAEVESEATPETISAAPPRGRRQQPTRRCKATTPAPAPAAAPASASDDDHDENDPVPPSIRPPLRALPSLSPSPTRSHTTTSSPIRHREAWNANLQALINDIGAADQNSSDGVSHKDIEDVEGEAAGMQDPDIRGRDMASIKRCALLVPVLLLLVGALLWAIRQCCVGFLRPPPPASPRLTDQCLRSSSTDLPLLPAGARAPLSAMAMTLALYPDYSLTWILEQAPIVEPHIDSPALQRAAADLARAVRSDYGYTRTPQQGKLLDWWWDRLLLPSTYTARISEHVQGALAIRATPSWKRVGLRVLCATLPSWDARRCAAYAFLHDPIQTGFLPTSVAAITRRACLQPGIQLNVSRSRTASRQLQARVLAAVQEIADQSSHDFSTFVRALSRAELRLLPDSLELPPTVPAPWSPPDASSTRRQKVHFLRTASQVGGVQIPSTADQQQLNALAALYAKALYFEFVASFIESLNSAIQRRCDFVVDVTSSLEADAFDRLLPLVLNDSNDHTHLDADSLIFALLNMTDSAFQQLQDHMDRHHEFPLLQSVSSTDHGSPDLDPDHVAEFDSTLWIPSDRRPAKSFIGASAPDHAGEADRSPIKASPRSVFDKAWKAYALAEARAWGKMRSETFLSESSTSAFPPRPTWLQCLAKSSSSDHSSLAMQAVWAFWQTGASPNWYTYDYPTDRDQDVGNGALYPPQSPEYGAMTLGALEVDLQHVFGWGLEVD